MCAVCQSVFCYKFSLWEGKRAMCAMLCYSHFVKKSIQAVQTWSNSNSMHIDVRHNTEQRFVTFLIRYASCTCVCTMLPSQARCCATSISSRNRFKPYKLDRIATACILMCAIRQNSVSLRFWWVTHHTHVCVLCQSVQVPCARCCATSISSRNRFKAYILDRRATACILMCAIRHNSVSLRFWWVTHHAHVCAVCQSVFCYTFSL